MREFRTALRRVCVKGGADITVLRPVTANNVVQQMRILADDIERGRVVAESVIAVVDMGDGIDLYQWGNFDPIRSTGVLTLALDRHVGVQR